MFAYLLFIFVTISQLTANPLENEFTNIYLNGTWGKNEKGEGTSGGGSTLENAKAYINFVQKFITDYNIKTVVDAGCGDWEFAQHMNWANIEYSGYDIVKFVIEKNIQRFSAPNIKFIHCDFTTINLPAADLLLCKDVLQHLDRNTVKNFLPQLQKYKYCLITNGKKLFNISELNGNPKIIYTYSGGEEKDIILIQN